MWTYETHHSFPYIHFRPDDNWSILSQHQPDFKSVQRAFFLETKLVSYVQATDSDCWYNHHTALTGVGLTSYPYHFRLDSQEEAQPKKVKSAIPHKLSWVLKVSPNVQHSILKKHWHTILPEQSPPLYPAGHWQVPLLVSQVPPFWHCGWHTIPVWTTMCGSDDEFKI